MNRGPAPGSARQDRTMADKAVEGWGSVPDWVLELAGLVDRTGLRAAGARIGYSASAVSTVINGRYPGDLTRIEECVRGALMGMNVSCPVLGDLGRDQCLAWQKKPFAATSSMRVAVWRACRAGCPHSTLTKEVETP